MQVWVFDREINKKGVINTYISLQWGESYQNRGVFTLVVSDTQENINLLQEEYLLFMTGKSTAMVIKERSFDDTKQILTIRGFTTIEFLNQRILYGYKTITNAEQGMRQMVSENLRGLPVSQTANKGYQELFNAQYSNALLLDIFPEICAETELGIIMLFDHYNKKHIFDVYKGVDRTFGQSVNVPVLFGEQWHNLNNALILDDKSIFKNVAYVLGGGEGLERIYVEVGTSQGRDRYELPVDAKDLQQQDGQSLEQYKQLLVARGIAKLNEHNQRASFQAEVDGRDFGIKYNLGDKITCKSQKYGIQLNTRIMQYNQVVENNVSKIFLTLGQPEITVIGELKLWLS